MERRRRDGKGLSRRGFLGSLRFAPALYLPAPLRLGRWLSLAASGKPSVVEPELLRLKPDYPDHSPLDGVLRLVAPGLDQFITEKYEAELQSAFERLRGSLLGGADLKEALIGLVRTDVIFNSPSAVEEKQLPTSGGFELRKRTYRDSTAGGGGGAERFLPELMRYFGELGKIETAEFEMVSLKTGTNPLELETRVRYSLVGSEKDRRREERIGTWRIHWRQESNGNWKAARWFWGQEFVGRAGGRLFADVTEHAFGQIPSYREQLGFGVDHWRTVLDGACGIDVYGNNGIAAGDFDGDGRDDLYICQPSGLPNRLYRNRGDGTFEDATERAGLGVLDATASAIFADFENKGRQDLLVVAASGPLLFVNQGKGKFELKTDAFAFAKPPQGTFTHAAVADYDGDGRLDVYFCLYSYYLGLDQYHYPAPYFDARNGPPNFLFHNDGGMRFSDRTEAAGLNAENDRFSFACAWGDISGSGGPDLYVANDFGRSNLYRNNGGTFRAVSEAAGVNVPGAGMSACWCDFDNDGRQDIYVSNMWAAAGQRVSEQEVFHARDDAPTRAFYRGHARGNSLYRNRGNGRLESVGESAGAAMGRWAWSADAWDFDHDGHSDLYIANGYISGSARGELSSFFWRQVVGNSPSTATPSTAYEHGWNAINELIRSDHTWNGYERNTLYVNQGDGDFCEISGLSGLDFREDGRAFALGDFDGDGRLEIALKNRNAPQVRLLRNVMREIGNAVSFRLRGTKSNRDAIGSAITVQCGELRQTKYVQAGSGFLSQHGKEIFFGVGNATGPVTASVRWPSGLTQTFAGVPANRRIAIEEGRAEFSATPFERQAEPAMEFVRTAEERELPEQVATWLLEPLPAPDFSLPDLSGETVTLSKFRGKLVLICFWSKGGLASVQQLQRVQRSMGEFAAKGLRVLCLNVDELGESAALRAFARANNLTLPMLSATKDVAGVYNLVYRYLFDRRRDLPLPCSFLVDDSGQIARVYQGLAESANILADAKALPRTYEARVEQALPFPGTLHNGRFARNDFTYGVAFFQHGYLEQAEASFRQVITAKPDNAEAYYNLGTLKLRKNDLEEARRYLQQTVKLQPEYPEAWNNLGMIAGQHNQFDEAIQHFQKSLAQRPDYVTALLNLGSVYRRQGNTQEASRLLTRAVELEPENAEANYGLGMLYARQTDLSRAAQLLHKAITLRPDYAEAINNLGVLYVQQKKNAEAQEQFTTCIRVAPNFDQAYLNLARLYMLLGEKDKARDTLQALLKIQPQHKLAQQALEMLN